MDTRGIHAAIEVQHSLVRNALIVLLWLLRHYSAANPIQRVFGDVHEQITRNYRR